MSKDLRNIGRTPFRTGAIALGCVTLGREIGEEESFRLLDAAYTRGIRLFDTAEAYGGGQSREYRRRVLGVADTREAGGEMHSSEKILGRWLRHTGVRREVVVQTKVSSGFTPEAVQAAIRGSRERLQTETLDVYLLHRRDPRVPLAETFDALGEAAAAGMVTAVGVSNFAVTDLREALALPSGPRIETVQPAYSLLERGIEAELLPLCRERQISVIPYSPLAAGFLTGKYTPDRAALPVGSRFHVVPGHADVYFSERNFRVVDKLRGFAAKTGVPAARLALAWVFRNRDLTSVLVGARSIAHLDQAREALEFDLPAAWHAEMSAW